MGTGCIKNNDEGCKFQPELIGRIGGLVPPSRPSHTGYYSEMPLICMKSSRRFLKLCAFLRHGKGVDLGVRALKAGESAIFEAVTR
jgi:hypothetical protein